MSGFWSFYFLAKLGLHAVGMLQLNWWANLLFTLALLWRPRPAWRRPRHWAAVAVGLALAWHDSYWPSPLRLVQEWQAVSAFSAGYFEELVGRVVSWRVVGALLLGAGLHALLAQRVRLGAVALVGLLCIPMASLLAAHRPDTLLAARPATPAASATSAGLPEDTLPADPQAQGQALSGLLDGFYRQEHERAVAFPTARDHTPAFDLVFLSVCSLSWDDLQAAGMGEAPLLRRFDLLFRQFNSASSYSGPAVLRLLHAGCGQGPQHTLYEPTPANCYLFRRLEEAGYAPALLMNHDGHFDRFAEQLRNQGAMGLKPADNRGAPIAMQAFDGTPVFGDYALLSRWWEHGGDRQAPRALLYNTISLHDGNRRPGDGSSASATTWKPRAQQLFDDFERFFSLVEQSGRPTVVVLVPEHGAAIRGDEVQIEGLREIPTPRITHVPAAVALLGFPGKPAGQAPIVVDQVTSYTALAGTVAALLRSPQAPWQTLETVARTLPPTRWVAENDSTVVMRANGQLFIRTDGAWSRWRFGP